MVITLASQIPCGGSAPRDPKTLGAQLSGSAPGDTPQTAFGAWPRGTVVEDERKRAILRQAMVRRRLVPPGAPRGSPGLMATNAIPVG